MRLMLRFILISFGFWLMVGGGLLTAARSQTPQESYWLVFVRQRFGEVDIYRSLPNGEGAVRLLEDVSFLHRISFAPDGQSFVFDAEFADVPFHQLYRYQVNDGSLEQITSAHARAYAPAWSPDGAWIAYIAMDNLSAATPRNPNMPNTFIVNFAQVYLARPDGSEAHAIAQTVNDGRVQWSADGDWLAFVQYTDLGGADIFIMRPDGSDQRQLTDARGDDLSPVWSPDGTQIAFISDRDTLSGTYLLYIMNADGTNQRRLLPHFSFNGAPQWSPDGKWIAFVDDRNGTYQIYRVHPDGSDLQQVTQFGYRGGQAWAPAWSPVFSHGWRGSYLLGVGGVAMVVGIMGQRRGGQRRSGLEQTTPHHVVMPLAGGAPIYEPSPHESQRP